MRVRSQRRVLVLAAGLALIAARAHAEEPLSVTVQPLSELAQPIHADAPAEVVSRSRAELAARLAAPIDRIRVDVGDRVDSGAIVAELECVDAGNRLERAQSRREELAARKALARTRLERTQRLLKQDAATPDELDEARSEFDAAAANLRVQNAAVEAAERDVERCTIEAPFAGVVTARPRQPGSYVQPGTPVIELIDPAAIVLSERVQQRHLDALEAANEASFRSQGRRYPARLRRVVPQSDPTTRTREVRLAFIEDQPLPGVAGRIRWRVTDRALPADMLVRRDGQLGVMRRLDGRAHFEPLPAAVEGRPVATDLAPDTPLIVRGRYSVADGDPIQVSE